MGSVSPGRNTAQAGSQKVALGISRPSSEKIRWWMPPGSKPATWVAPTSKVKFLRLKVEAQPPGTMARSYTVTG